jgi:hypothetical protein
LWFDICQKFAICQWQKFGRNLPKNIFVSVHEGTRRFHMKHARNGKFLPNFCHWQNPAKLLTLANGKWQMTNKVILQSPFLGNTTHLTPAADGEAD